ncbi:DUF4331 family protein [Croceivirga thetidis]|nr:DUF4331 family protein [Croceivirga thetidis]
MNNVYRLQIIMLMSLFLTVFTACDSDDNNIMVEDDVMMDDDMMMDDDTSGMEPDFSGTYSQVDFMGRPGINTVLSANGDIKDMHNQAIPNEMGPLFQPGFQSLLEAYHDAYAEALGLTAEDVDYEPNILGDILNGPDDDGFTNNPVTAEVLTTVLASDVLEVAPNAPTTYFNPGMGAPTYEGGIGLTGRTPQDDIIDVSLILLFGGGNGARFNGEGGLPQLVTDGVGLTASISDTFPYLGNPE